MQSLMLENYGAVEMSSTEMVNVDGGFIPLLIIAAVAIVASSCASTAPSSLGPAAGMPQKGAYADSTSHK